jgi:thioredoxin reductase
MTHDLAIIGAGPAGMAAATLAAELGLSAIVLDEQDTPGGQIYRAIERAAPPPGTSSRGSPLGPDYLAGRDLAAAFRASKAEYRPRRRSGTSTTTARSPPSRTAAARR